MPSSTDPSQRGYKSIYRRVLCTLLLMALLPLIALGLFSLDRIGAVYDEKVSTGLEVVISSKQRALDTFMTERLAQVKTLAFTHSFTELQQQERLSQIFSILQGNSRSYVDLGIIGMDGRHVAYVGPFDLRNANYAEAPWFIDVVRKGVHISDVFMGFRQVPHFIIAVLRHDGDHSFIVRATVDMEVVSALIQQKYSGPRSDVFVINHEGILQTPSRFNGKVMERCSLFKDTNDIADATEAKNKLSRTSLVTEEVIMPDGNEMLVAMTNLHAMPWILVAMDDIRAGLQPLHQLRGFILLFMVFGGVIIYAGAILSTRRLMSTLEDSDQRQAQVNAAMLQSSKMAALGKMAAGVAHEVNNPLTLIQENAGWIQDLLGDEDPSAMKNYKEILESTQKIEQHVQRAKGITQRMLGFGRRMNPGRTEVLINTLADQSLEMLKTEANNRSITIVRNYDPKVPIILSDPSQLEQVFINIVDNAIDALGKGGSITVTTQAHDKGVLVIIEDTGPGMTQETMEHIFDPFFTTKKVGEGTGLGLAICFTILEKLGGDLKVCSTLGEGTSFRISLPAEPPENPQ